MRRDNLISILLCFAGSRGVILPVMPGQVNPALSPSKISFTEVSPIAVAARDGFWHNIASLRNRQMELPVERWYPAIFKRHSRRTYLAEVPAEDKLARLDQVCREFKPFPEVRSQLVRRSPERVFKGLIGHYGRVSGASIYVAFIGKMSSSRVQEAVGYVGEGIILEATALGLATCWVGGFFRPEGVRSQIDIKEGEKVLSVTPVGHSPAEKSGQEKIMSGLVKSRLRKPLAKLVAGEIAVSWLAKALEAARVAPSAQNRQPWRFRIDKDAVIIAADRSVSTSTISKRLDCGIAMLHFELGALAAGVAGKWEILSSPNVARFVCQPNDP
jgi:nitroreductase